jgi:hypothetical protein
MIVEYTTFRDVVERIIGNDDIRVIDCVRHEFKDVRNSLVRIMPTKIVELPIALPLDVWKAGDRYTSTVDNWE